MRYLMIVLAGLALLPPFPVHASDVAEGEVTSAEVETEEAAHEQTEEMRIRSEEDKVIAEFKAAEREDEAAAKAAEGQPAQDGDGTDVPAPLDEPDGNPGEGR